MNGENWLLVVFGLLCFTAAGWLAVIKQNLWLWRWADAIYYPLAAVGVALLFLSNDMNRNLLRLQREQAALERTWELEPNVRPELHLSMTSSSLLTARLDRFLLIRRLGEVCKVSADPKCGPWGLHAEAFDVAFGDFNIPATADGLKLARVEEEFCQKGDMYVEALQKVTLNSSIFQNLELSLAKLSSGTDLAPIEDGLKRSIEHDRRVVKPNLSADQLKMFNLYFDVHAKHAIELLDMLSWCATRGTSQKRSLEALRIYEGIELLREEKRKRYAREVQDVSGGKLLTLPQQFFRSVREEWWPYVLILALALKFGKAVLAVADDAGRIWERSQTRLKALMARRKS